MNNKIKHLKNGDFKVLPLNQRELDAKQTNLNVKEYKECFLPLKNTTKECYKPIKEK